MTSFEETFAQVQERLGRKKKLPGYIRELKSQLIAKEQTVEELEAILQSEQRDVERLKGLSLANLFSTLAGDKERKLEQEQIEYLAAKAKYEVAAKELESIQESLNRYETELASMEDYETQYQQMLNQRIEIMKAQNHSKAQEIAELEEQNRRLKQQRIHIQEAMEAGNKALTTCDKLRSQLARAQGWSNWDAYQRGGLVSDIAKYDALKEAESIVGVLQCQLSEFKTEMADVKISRDLYVGVDSLTHFADIFFDSVFVDLSVRAEISSSLSQTEKTRQQILEAKNKLGTMADAISGEQTQIKQQIESMLLEG